MRGPRKPRALAPKAKQQVMQIVKATIARQTENKMRGFNVEQNVVHNSAIADADVVPILGSILEGTGHNERIGDRVKPKSLTLRGIVGLNSENNPNNKPMIVSVYVLACKDKKTNALVTAGAGMADLLAPNIGGTEEVPFDGTTLRSTYPVNTDKFRVYYQKKFRIAPAPRHGHAGVRLLQVGIHVQVQPHACIADLGRRNWRRREQLRTVPGHRVQLHRRHRAGRCGHPTDQQHLRRIPLRRRVNPQQNWRESPGLRTKVQTPKSPDPRSVQPARTLRKHPRFQHRNVRSRVTIRG